MSKPSPQHPALAANPTLTEREAFDAWQRHVDAGRFAMRAAPDHARRWREHVEAGRIDGASLPAAGRPDAEADPLVDDEAAERAADIADRHARNARILKGQWI